MHGDRGGGSANSGSYTVGFPRRLFFACLLIVLGACGAWADSESGAISELQSANFPFVMRLLANDSVLPFGDFASYWAAAHVLFHGGNPYDPAAIEAMLAAYGWHGMQLYHPPFVLILLAPVLAFPLPLALLAWGLASIAALIFVVNTSVRWSGAKAEFVSYAGIIITFFPAWLIFRTGQFGLLQIGCIVGALRCMQCKRDWTAGIMLGCAFVKVHLVLPAVLGMSWWLLKNRRLFVLYSSAVVLAGAAVAAELVCPGVWGAWIAAPGSGAEWVTAASSSYIRLIGGRAGFDLRWVQILFLAVGCVAAILLAQRSRRDSNLPDLAASLLSISVIAAPYAWVSDFSLLLLPYSLLFARQWILRAALSVLMGFALILYLHLPYDFQSWWVAPALALIWFCDQSYISRGWCLHGE